MRRVAPLLSLALAVLLADSLPVPPIPPADPPSGQSAPMPNATAAPPSSPASTQASIEPSLFRADRRAQGLGYAPGSQFQDSEDRKPIQTPGLVIRVPLQ